MELSQHQLEKHLSKNITIEELMPIAPYKVPTLLSILAALEDMANGSNLYTMWKKQTSYHVQEINL